MSTHAQRTFGGMNLRNLRSIDVPLRICFVTTYQTNVGDDFVREGIRAVLDSLVAYSPYLVNKHFTAATCGAWIPEDCPIPLKDKILDADAVIQCGGPVYWNLGPNHGQKCSNTEWVGPVWHDRIAHVAHAKPVLNLAAGACQPYSGTAEDIISDSGCARFIRNIHSFCRLTTVRDRMAERVLVRLGLASLRQPCASILAWRRHPVPQSSRTVIALNFMPLGGHFPIDATVQSGKWARSFQEIVRLVKATGHPIRFVAHSRSELTSLSELFPGAPVFFSADYRDYFRFYAECRGGILNRIHGGMLLAGSGAPAVVVGNDSRCLALDEIGMPRFYVGKADPRIIVQALIEMLEDSRVNQRLAATENGTFLRLYRLCAAALGLDPDRAAHQPSELRGDMPRLYRRSYPHLLR